MLAATLGITGHRTSANQSDRRQRHTGGVEELRQSILTSGVDQIAILIHIHVDGTGRWPAGKLTQKSLQHTDWTTSESDPVEKHARWIGWSPDWCRKRETSRLSCSGLIFRSHTGWSCTITMQHRTVVITQSLSSTLHIIWLNCIPMVATMNMH